MGQQNLSGGLYADNQVRIDVAKVLTPGDAPCYAVITYPLYLVPQVFAVVQLRPQGYLNGNIV